MASGLRYLSSLLTIPPTLRRARWISGYIAAKVWTRFLWEAFTRERAKKGGYGSFQRRLLVTSKLGLDEVGALLRMGMAQVAVV